MIEVDTESFENDFETFRSRDDVLTLLIHLGYLTWNEEEETTRIPNEEVRIAYPHNHDFAAIVLQYRGIISLLYLPDCPFS